MVHAASILLVVGVVIVLCGVYFAYIIFTRNRATTKPVRDGDETEEVRQQLVKH